MVSSFHFFKRYFLTERNTFYFMLGVAAHAFNPIIQGVRGRQGKIINTFCFEIQLI